MTTTYTRASAWSHGGTFANSDLLWYAKGVRKMMERQLNDPASWWFFAAIHGEYVNPDSAWYPKPPAFPAWGDISGQPAVPTTPLPSQLTRGKFWNQCQHGTWYFLPWHRGYLLALEAQLRADIIAQGGPKTWALPYWDYFGGAQGAEAAIPPAFTAHTLPDGSPNALFVTMRYGPNGGGNIYVPTPAWQKAHSQAPKPEYGDVTNACLKNTLYTGSNAATHWPGFGGPDTGFSHSGGGHGNMESNPHDLVHVYVGGSSNPVYGLMADPGTAALDPIFYLHHCNIDRMWAAWNDAGHANPSQKAWLDGPPQPFVMPMPGAEPWVYTPRQVQSPAALHYTYQAPVVAHPPAGPNLMAQRLVTLGALGNADQFQQMAGATTAVAKPPELVGANGSPVQLSKAGLTAVNVALHPEVQQNVVKSLQLASAVKLPDQLYLKLENVRGTQDATVLRVYLELPPTADQDTQRSQFVGSVALFGLRRASVKDGAHGGAGLTFVLDISPFVDALYVQKKLSGQQIKVDLEAAGGQAPSSPIEVGRVSIYRQPM